MSVSVQPTVLVVQEFCMCINSPLVLWTAFCLCALNKLLRSLARLALKMHKRKTSLKHFDGWTNVFQHTKKQISSLFFFYVVFWCIRFFITVFEGKICLFFVLILGLQKQSWRKLNVSTVSFWIWGMLVIHIIGWCSRHRLFPRQRICTVGTIYFWDWSQQWAKLTTNVHFSTSVPHENWCENCWNTGKIVWHLTHEGLVFHQR